MSYLVNKEKNPSEDFQNTSTQNSVHMQPIIFTRLVWGWREGVEDVYINWDCFIPNTSFFIPYLEISHPHGTDSEENKCWE